MNDESDKRIKALEVLKKSMALGAVQFSRAVTDAGAFAQAIIYGDIPTTPEEKAACVDFLKIARRFIAINVEDGPGMLREIDTILAKANEKKLEENVTLWHNPTDQGGPKPTLN